MKIIYINLVFFVLLSLAFTNSPKNAGKWNASVKYHALNSKNFTGCGIFKQAYSAVQKSRFTALSDDDYNYLLKNTIGNRILTTKHSHTSFDKVIIYSKQVNQVDTTSQEYKYISKILAKYE